MPQAIPLPALGGFDHFFWVSGADGRLRFLRCTACSTFVHPPKPSCPSCHSAELATTEVSGRARLQTWTVNHQQWHPAFAPPYVLAIVAIEEDQRVRLTTRLLDCAEDQLALDLPVEVVFEQHEDVWLPLFRPVSA